MLFLDKISHLFAFRTLVVTTAVVLVYAAIFTSTVIIEEDPPDVGQKDSLDVAWRDLQVIAKQPHPYNSHYNDVVREHVLTRIEQIADGNPHMTVVNDVKSNGTYWKNGVLVYFEGNNVLAKIEGTVPSLDPVLLDAHFDSVATGAGATDDGMGVATLISLAQHFSSHRPKRTLIFNLNNGEEDFLNGAMVFFDHPWSSLPKTFLNLEGAASGGRPILFRTSNARVTRAFQSAPHPHGNSLSADGFNMGLIRSQTDYVVYEAEGMAGLDLAFYRKRSRYHTKYDSVSQLGSKMPLWAMMENSLAATWALANDLSDENSTKDTVYFDLFGESMAVFEQSTFFIFNLLLLIVGPLLVIILTFLAHRKRKLYWTGRGWLRLPAAIALATFSLWLINYIYVRENPFIFYSAPYAVLVSCLSLFFTVAYLSLQTMKYLRPIPLQRTIILLELYIFFWIILLLGTILMQTRHLSGLYFLTFFNASSLAALLLAYGEIMMLEPKSRLAGQIYEGEDENIETTLEADTDTRRGTYGSVNGEQIVRASVDDAVNHTVQEDIDASTEQTPLIRIRRKIVGLKSERFEEKQVDGFWLGELLLILPFPLILVTQLALMLLAALSQTLSDGQPPSPVFSMIGLAAFLMVIPVTPFIHKTHFSIAIFTLTIFALTYTYSLTAFPFSPANPLKIYFQQTIDLDSGFNTVTYVGMHAFLKDGIVDAIPSASGQKVHCKMENMPGTVGLESCSWIGDAPRVVHTSDTKKWLEFNVTRLSKKEASFSIKARNSRNVRLYFDTPIISAHVFDQGSKLLQKYPIPKEDGVKEMRLWSRGWGKTFDVSVTFAKSQDTYSGKVAGEWAEALQGRIPAYDEMLAFLPRWSAGTKMADGLVEGTKIFKV